MLEILDWELDAMQIERSAYIRRMRAKSIRLESLGGIEPASVDRTLEQLIDDHYASQDLPLSHMCEKSIRIEKLGIDPVSIDCTLEQFIDDHYANIDMHPRV